MRVVRFEVRNIEKVFWLSWLFLADETFTQGGAIGDSLQWIAKGCGRGALCTAVGCGVGGVALSVVSWTYPLGDREGRTPSPVLFHVLSARSGSCCCCCCCRS